MLEEKIEQDLKTALLGRDQTRVATLKLLKSALLNQKIAAGKREQGLSDDEVIAVLKKQSKQRQESAELYLKGGNQAKAEAENSEKAIIDAYLPAPMAQAELIKIIDEVVAASADKSLSSMGQIISEVRSRVGAAAEGSLIAGLVRERLK